MDLRTAERCLHDRSGAAFAAAAEAGLPGRFRAFEHDGLLALLTTSPGLGFLNSVCGLTSESLDALPAVLAIFAAAGAPLPRLATDGPALATDGPVLATDGPALAGRLRQLGFGPAQARPAATTDLPSRRAFPAEPHGLRLTEARTPEQQRVFLDTLTAGYEASPELSRFLRAEHCADGMRRFVAWQGHQPVAAAAFSMHGHVAVLGGAAARRSGAQAALLHHRLNQAAAAGAEAATATAAAESASVRNLVRIGFDVRYRQGWERLAVVPE